MQNVKKPKTLFGVSAAEAVNALRRLTVISEAVIDAQEAELKGDWDGYENACDRMTDEELEREIHKNG